MGQCCVVQPKEEPVAKYQARENAFRKVNTGPEFQVIRKDSLGQAAKDHTIDLMEKGRISEINGTPVLIEESQCENFFQ